MRKTILFAALLAMTACDGPWNTMPDDSQSSEPVLRVSLFAVGGRNWDTLWLERTQPLSQSYDSTRAFVDPAGTSMAVEDSRGRVAMTWHLAASSAVAWVPDSQKAVSAGTEYVLRAHVRWNADWNWPAAATWRTADIQASTAVPATWSVDHVAKAPVEMLIPQLAAGGEVGEGTAILDSLDRRFPGWSARWGLTGATLDSLRRGAPVFRSVRSGDSLWYISDLDHKVTNFDGKTVERAYRQILFTQHPGAGFSGEFAVNRFDPQGFRVLDPITKALRETLGKTSWSAKDSASLFQAGDTRYVFGPYSAYAPDLYGWPATFPFTNLYLTYTGINTFYFYSVDSQYVVYQSQLQKSASGDNTALPYTNVKGATGYFAGALVDSFRIHNVVEGAQLFPVPGLRGAACRESYRKTVEDGRTFNPDPVCKGVPLR